MKRSTAFRSALHYIREARTILCASPEDPDGDSVGCLCALRLFLLEKNKRVTLYAPDPVPQTPIVQSLSGIETVITILPQTTYDLIILVDYGDSARTRLPRALLERSFVIGFDHHAEGRFEVPHGLAINVPTYSSATLLVYEFLRFIRHAISPEVAHCLFVGLCTDTQFFRNSLANSHALRIASELVRYGASVQGVSTLMKPRYSHKTITAWREGLDRLEIRENIGLLVSSEEDLRRHDLSYRDVAGLMESLLMHVQELDVLAFVTQKEGIWSGSLRSPSGRANVADVAKLFGGGGHAGAAGFISDLPIEKIRERLFSFANTIKGGQ